MANTLAITTAEQLLQAGDIGRCELIRGELVMMSPAGFEHGRLVSRFSRRLEDFVEPRKLGVICSGDPGFVIGRDPDTVRAPDVAFVSRSRVPHATHRGYLEGAPDLAVEVLSPSDRPGEVRQKVQDWLAAGCQAVWVVDPHSQTVTVYGPDGQSRVLEQGETLEGGSVLPGFALRVSEIFAL